MIPTDYVQYQAGLITHVLRITSRTYFTTVIDIGCGATGRVLRAVVPKVLGRSQKG